MSEYYIQNIDLGIFGLYHDPKDSVGEHLLEVYDDIEFRNYGCSDHYDLLRDFLFRELDSDIEISIVETDRLTRRYSDALWKITYLYNNESRSVKINFRRFIKPVQLFYAESDDEVIKAKFYPDIDMLYLESHDYYLPLKELGKTRDLSQYDVDWLCNKEIFEEYIQPKVSV